MFWRFHLLILSSLLALTSCATTDVSTNVLKPAEINMAGYERITVGEFDGEGSTQLRQRLISAISNSGMYEVIDRDNIRQGMGEQELIDLGLVDSDSSYDDGGFLAATSLVTGSILRNDFSQFKEKELRTRYDSNNNPHNYTVYRNTGTSSVTSAIKVIDLESMMVVAPATIESSYTASTSWVEGNPPGVAPGPLTESCYKETVTRFMHKIAPFTESVVVTLYKKQGPPSNKSGIQYFKSGNYQRARDMFEEALAYLQADPKSKPKEYSRVYYNLAVACEYCNDYSSAQKYYEEAIRNKSEKKYIQAAQRCSIRLADYRELRNQGIVKPN